MPRGQGFRARLLKPGFFTNEDLAELPFEVRLLFAGTWCLADREGRLEDRPRRIRAAIFPYDQVDVEAGLQLLHAAGFLVRYKAGDGGAYIQVLQFKEHQRPHPKEPRTSIPGPDGLGFTQGEPEDGLGFTQGEPEDGLIPSEAGSSEAGSSEAGSSEAEAEAKAAAGASAAQVRRRLQGLRIPYDLANLDEALDESGAECLEHCIDEAVGYNRLSWAYVDTVRRRHAAEGCPDPNLTTRTERLTGRRRYQASPNGATG